MKHIKRCYGCGKLIWPWQNTIYSKYVNAIHKKCLISAYSRYVLIAKKTYLEYMKDACETLGVEEE